MLKNIIKIKPVRTSSYIIIIPHHIYTIHKKFLVNLMPRLC